MEPPVARCLRASSIRCARPHGGRGQRDGLQPPSRGRRGSSAAGGLLEVALDAVAPGVSLSHLRWRWLTDLLDQFGEIAVGLREQFPAARGGPSNASTIGCRLPLVIRCSHTRKDTALMNRGNPVGWRIRRPVAAGRCDRGKAQHHGRPLPADECELGDRGSADRSACPPGASSGAPDHGLSPERGLGRCLSLGGLGGVADVG